MKDAADKLAEAVSGFSMDIWMSHEKTPWQWTDGDKKNFRDMMDLFMEENAISPENAESVFDKSFLSIREIRPSWSSDTPSWLCYPICRGYENLISGTMDEIREYYGETDNSEIQSVMDDLSGQIRDAAEKDGRVDFSDGMECSFETVSVSGFVLKYDLEQEIADNKNMSAIPG